MKAKTKKYWIILGILNLLLFGIHTVVTAGLHQDDLMTTTLTSWESEKARQLSYDTPPIKRGVYTVSARYRAEGDNNVLFCTAGNGDGYAYPLLYMDSCPMYSWQNEMSARLWVNDDVDQLSVRMYTETVTEDLQVDEVRLERMGPESFLYLTLRFLVVLLLADGIAAAVIMRESLWRLMRENLYVVLGLLAVFGICSLSAFTYVQNEGHDMTFHMARIAGLAQGLAEDGFPVRIQPGWCFDYGYAVSIFYGDLLLYVPALLYLCGVPLIYCYKCYLLFIHAGTIGISYYCYRRLSRDKHIAVVCSALYSLSVNRILNVYVRGAVGEYTAYMFLPFVLLGVKELWDDSTEEEPAWQAGLFLCIGMTGIVQSHVLSFEMTCFMLGVTAVILCRRVFRKKALMRLLACIAVTICLNLGFLLPFLESSGMDVSIFDDKNQYGIQESGLSLYELFFLSEQVGGIAKPPTETMSGRIAGFLGLGIIAVLLLTVIALIRYQWNREERRRVLFLMGLSGLALFMTTYYFPWNRLAGLPIVRSLVASLQFPWRFVSVAMPILVYLSGVLLVKLRTCLAPEKTKCVLVGLYLLTALQGMYYIDQTIRNVDLTVYDGYNHLRQESVINGEYLLTSTTGRRLALEQEPVAGDAVVSDVERSGNRTQFSVRTGTGNAYVELPLFAYDHYRCSDVATGEEFAVTRGDNNKIHIDLPSNWQGELSVRYVEPWYWRLAEIISILTFVGLVLYVSARRRSERRRVAGQ